MYKGKTFTFHLIIFTPFSILINCAFTLSVGTTHRWKRVLIYFLCYIERKLFDQKEKLGSFENQFNIKRRQKLALYSSEFFYCHIISNKFALIYSLKYFVYKDNNFFQAIYLLTIETFSFKHLSLQLYVKLHNPVMHTFTIFPRF